LSQYQLAKELNVPARRINEIVHDERRITADPSSIIVVPRSSGRILLV
jgi:plasmid maintenance system antidote protein VapI